MVEEFEKDSFAVQVKSIQITKTNKKDASLSIVLPAYNEASTIEEVVTGYFDEIVTRLPCRLVVAEDGSIDETPQILTSLARKLPICLYSDRKRKGYAKGVQEALKKCDEDWIFFSDSDMQYFPSDFWKLWENREGHDLIIGRKVHRDEGIHRIIMSKVFHGFVNQLFGLSLKDSDCGFRLIKKEVLQSVLDDTKILKYSFWTEFTVRACLRGFKVHEVPIKHANRENGGTRIYTPSKIPIIILKQLIGLAALYSETKKISINSLYTAKIFIRESGS